jgi:outer membrane protein assembly factor BamA
MNHSFPLSFGGSLTLRGRLGHIIGLSTDSPYGPPAISSSEAFFMGGAESVPGFQSRGIARSTALEALGAASYWLSSAHYIFGIPSVPDFIKGQVHASACGVSGVIGGNEEQKRGFFSAFTQDSLRASVGFGMVGVLPGAGRLSLTFSKVLASNVGDNMTTGVQLSLVGSFD